MEYNQDELNEEYEKICFLCRRPESKTGKMVEMGNNICICRECMQKAVDSMQASGLSYQDLLSLSQPVMNGNHDEKKTGEDEA